MKSITDEKKAAKLYDYSRYTMRPVDRLIAFVVGFAAAVIVLHIFFGNIFLDVTAGVVLGIVAQPIYRKMMIEKNQKQLITQFRDMLDSLNSSISAGKVVSEAFVDAEKDMGLQYGQDSFIYKEIRAINYGVMNSVNIEELLLDFGTRSGVDDIMSFANVFAVANRRGGEMKSIIGETKSILCDKIDIDQEIHTMVNASKNELNVMMLMPLLVVPMMSSFSQESDNQMINISVKIAGIIIFVVAYIIGRKIVKIKV